LAITDGIAECTPNVARGRDDAAFPCTADRDRLPAQLRVVALLDRCVERIHVDMDDLARPGRLGRRSFRALFGPHVSPYPNWWAGGCGS
jgi:hypothetical protein